MRFTNSCSLALLAVNKSEAAVFVQSRSVQCTQPTISTHPTVSLSHPWGGQLQRRYSPTNSHSTMTFLDEDVNWVRLFCNKCLSERRSLAPNRKWDIMEDTGKEDKEKAEGKEEVRPIIFLKADLKLFRWQSWLPSPAHLQLWLSPKTLGSEGVFNLHIFCHPISPLLHLQNE